MKQTLILLGLAAGVICDSTVRSRLGQVKAKTLAEQDQCSCVIPPGSVLGGVGNLGQGSYNTYEHSATATSGQTVQTIPDVAQTETTISQSCACSEQSSQSIANGNVGRHYEVQGAIEVGEEVFYQAAGTSTASSNGVRHKQAACTVNNVNGTLPGGPGSNCPSVCVQGNTATFSGLWATSPTTLIATSIWASRLLTTHLLYIIILTTIKLILSSSLSHPHTHN